METPTTVNKGKEKEEISSTTAISEASLIVHQPYNTKGLNNLLSSSLSLKLDENNFMLWRSMVLALLRGQRLESFPLGSKPKPSEFIISEESSTKIVVNPLFEDWHAVDQSLLGWLFSSMSHNVASEFLECITSRELWEKVESYFGSANTSRVNQLRTSLQNTRKGVMKMNEYLATMKQFSNNMALAGEAISLKQLISSILSGLDAEYLPITCQVNARANWTWQEFHATMMTFENTLEHLNLIQRPTEISQPAAHLAASRPNYSNGQNRGRNSNTTGNRYQGNQNTHQHSNRGGRNVRGRGGRNSNNRPTCQICGKYGHSGPYCFSRYDESYMGSPPTNVNTTNGGNNARPAAYATASDFNVEPTWFADTGATNHSTPDLSNLNQRTDYTGQGRADGPAGRDA